MTGGDKALNEGVIKPLLVGENPLDGQGNVIIPTTPVLGMEFDWDYTERNRVD